MIIMQSLVESERRTPVWEDKVWCFHFLPPGPRAKRLCLYCFTHRPIFRFFAIQGRHVASIKVKFVRVLREERKVLRPQTRENLKFLLPMGGSFAWFSRNLQGLCASLGYIWNLSLVHECPRKISKYKKMGTTKLCSPLRPLFRSILKKQFLPHYFAPCIVHVDVHCYKNISLFYYMVPQKTVKFVDVVPKTEGIIVLTETVLIRMALYRRCFV